MDKTPGPRITAARVPVTAAAGPGPRAAVEGPTPTPPRISLITSVGTIDEDSPRWGKGIAYEAQTCGAGTGRVGLCPGGETKESGNRAAVTEADPFAVYAAYECSTHGRRNEDDYKARARANLEAFFPKEVEEELWTGGAVPTNRRLAHPDADDLSPGGAQDPDDALACLEHYLGLCGSGGRGMIHATRRVATLWASMQLVRREGGLLLTVTDTIVVPGAGYPGTPPDADAGDVDPDPGADWAYATGMVQVRRELDADVIPETIDQALDRQENTVVFRAERAAVVTFDACCHAGVAITVPICGVGS